MSKKYKIAILPGDGIGPEVMRQAYKIINVLKKKFFLNIQYKNYLVGYSAIKKYKTVMPKETLYGCEKSNAILFGSVGDPRYNFFNKNISLEKESLLFIRKKFNLFCNIRPAKLYSKLNYLSPLKNSISINGIDILCIRELIGGIYFGNSKFIYDKNKIKKKAFDTEIYSKKEIYRISRIAFKIANKRKKKLTSIDKSNVLKSSILWREVVNEVSKEFPNVKLNHLYVDNAVMQIIKNPSIFDVILCSNIFGDIISDECAAIIGSIGLLPSASINEKKFGLYEPSGGSAPDIKNLNIANPIAQILSLSMMLKYTMKLDNISKKIDNTVKEVLELGYITKDLSNDVNKEYVSTDEMGDIIAQTLIKNI
ncbi:3-isopropylmalate dehydrogenase (plasmid) [Buchnera aphidicola (Ceratoglyphina bambusae)]|uniref:3-isopropylmalate dehydrogenase n=1 Tax=Buchnera aphidicola TaxID=9 RepID=UPI0031B81945